MKKLLVYFMAIAMVGMFSCTKDDNGTQEKEQEQEYSSLIPGMGDRRSEDVEISEKFVLPEGVEITSKIVGVAEGDPLRASALKSSSLDPAGQIYITAGMGNQVVVTFNIANITNTWQTVTIPAGTIFSTLDEEVQIGISLYATSLTIEPNKEATAVMYLFCVNKGYDTPDEHIVYDVVGDASNEQIQDYIDVMKTHLELAGLDLNDLDPSQEPLYSTSDILQAALWHIINPLSPLELNGEPITLEEAIQAFIDDLVANGALD